MVRLSILEKKQNCNTELDQNTANDMRDFCDFVFLTSGLNEYFFIDFHKRQVISM